MAINYFYTIFFLCFGLICLSVIGFKWILKQYLKIANDRRTLALQGVFFLTLGLLLALTTPLLFKEWSERLWSILTFALGIGFFLRGLLFIFAQTIIQKVLSFYLFKTPVSIALISALLFFVLAILTATRDYVGETPNLEACQDGNVLEVFCIVSNPEDMTLTPDGQFLITSEFAGIKPYEEPGIGDFAIIDLSNMQVNKLPIIFEDNVWGDPQCKRSSINFNPHGIDLIRRYDGSYQLGVVNHFPQESIEFFELQKEEAWELVWRGCVKVPKQYYVNDLTMQNNGTFYVSHMYPQDITIGQWLSASLFKYDTGEVLFWNKVKFNNLDFTKGGQPNGIVKKNNILYVAYNLSDEVKAFNLLTQEEIAQFKLNSPDNLILKDDFIWVTSFDHETLDVIATCPGYSLGDGISEEPSVCSLPFKVFKLDVKDLSLVKEFDFKKDAFGFPTVAYPVDEYIYLGSFTMDRIVRFKQ